jgi:hypothetical protein
MGRGSPRNPGNGAIDDLVFDCACQLFGAYNVEVQPGSREDFPAPERLALCGVLGFRGKHLSGSIVLACTVEPLELSNPTGCQRQRDWICELTNQLMGRVKNRLFKTGVEITLGTPAALSGAQLYPIPSRLRAPQVLAAGPGTVCAWLDYELTEGYELPSVPPPDAEAMMPEGGMILF